MKYLHIVIIFWNIILWSQSKKKNFRERDCHLGITPQPPTRGLYVTADFIYGWINMTHAISFKSNRLYEYVHLWCYNTGNYFVKRSPAWRKIRYWDNPIGFFSQNFSEQLIHWNQQGINLCVGSITLLTIINYWLIIGVASVLGMKKKTQIL